MAIISKTLEADLVAMGFDHYVLALSTNSMLLNVSEAKADEMIVYKHEPTFEMTTIKLPKKKEVNLDWVMNKLNAEKTFKNFTEDLKKILVKNGHTNSMNVYPTSYGIGIFVAVSYRNQTKVLKESIDTILNNAGIKYSNDRSNAGWVFRYRISKSKENIERLKSVDAL